MLIKKNSIPLYTKDELVELFFDSVKTCSPNEFLEIGCFKAEFSIRLRKFLQECKVTAFEANPYNYKKYHDAITTAGVNHVHSAVSNKEGKITFKLQNKDFNVGNNSILERTRDPIKGYVDVEVDCIKIDSFTDKQSKDICIWIDAEGVGYEVLLGAKETLKKTKYVIIEVEEIQYWKKQKIDADVYALMSEMGFKPIARDQEYSKQYNILFEKT